jgi:phage terminase large subunit
VRIDVNDPTAFVVAYVDTTNMKIYIADEMYEKALSNREIARWVIKNGYGKEIIKSDNSEPKSRDELKKLGLYRIKSARKGKDSILNGIQFIQNFQIIVHPSCTNAILELENYTWKKDKKTGEYLNTPIAEYNHLLDALRYALEDVMPRGRIRSMSKMKLGL